jgi:hypothetical protein
MKVKDLIENLKNVDPEATVILTSSNFELSGAEVPLSGILTGESGSKKSQTFRDAFDGGSYDKEVWSTFGGTEKVISLY